MPLIIQALISKAPSGSKKTKKKKERKKMMKKKLQKNVILDIVKSALLLPLQVMGL